MQVLSPKQITEKFANSSINKVHKPLITTIILGILAGAFIGFGAIFYTLVKVDPTFSFAVKQILGGVVFCVGLILVLVAGAELFTGNMLIAISVASKKVSLTSMIKNLIIIFFSNMVGALALAFLIYQSGHLDMLDGEVGKMYIKMSEGKVSLSFSAALIKGILCNILVCLAVWMAAAGKSLADKVLAIIFPITLFVAAGFEHSIANLFIIPLGIIANSSAHISESLNLISMINNIIPVVIGNIIGGVFFVGLLYHSAYKTK